MEINNEVININAKNRECSISVIAIENELSVLFSKDSLLQLRWVEGICRMYSFDTIEDYINYKHKFPRCSNELILWSNFSMM